MNERMNPPPLFRAHRWFYS